MSDQMHEQEKKRKLSPAEQRRTERFKQIAEELEAQGYRKTELTIGLVRANIYAVIFAVPVISVGHLLMALRMGESVFSMTLSPGLMALACVLFLVLAVVHEFLHGLTWSRFAPGRWKDIEFGYIREYATPYCTCKVSLSRNAYILGGLMPLIVLGFGMAAVALILASPMLMFLAEINAVGAFGDIMVVNRILRYRSDAKEMLYYDHPSEAGLIVFER